MNLLKSQKNSLFDLIEDVKLLPSMFSLEDYTDSHYPDATIIKYSGDNFYFIIYLTLDGKYFYEFTPAGDRVQENSYTYSWSEIITLFQRWLYSLKNETQIVDKWQQLKTEMPDFKITETNNEGKFSYEEVTQVETKIHLLKAKIKEIPLTASQVQVLTEKMDQCIELAKTATKFDWVSYFVGTITSIIIAMNVSTENAHLIWDAVKFVFNNFLLN